MKINVSFEELFADKRDFSVIYTETGEVDIAKCNATLYEVMYYQNIVSRWKSISGMPMFTLYNGGYPKWEHGSEYSQKQLVTLCGEVFECIEDHKSNVFGNDLFDKKFWKRFN